MHHSKPQLLLLLFFTLFVSACNLPKPAGRENQDPEGAATYFVESSDGEVIAETVHESIKFSKAKTFRFSVCLKDMTYSKPIVAAPFHVKEADQNIKSDAKGCVIWTEEVEYNALARPSYLYFERNIQAVGVHRGQRKMKLALNPWADGKDIKYALDISKKITAPQFIEDAAAAKLALFSDVDEARHLWINEGRLSIIQRHFVDGAAKLRVEFNTTPFLELVNINRVNYKKSIPEASVSVEMHLIQVRVETKNGKSVEVRHKLSDNSKEVQIFQIRNGELNVPSDLTLPENSTEGQLILGIKLNVLNQPKNMSPIAEFNGIYTIGGYHQLIGRTYISLVPESISKPGEKPFTIEDYINEAAQPSSKDGRQRAKINLENMKIEFRGYGKELNNEREVKFKVTACLTNGLDLRNVQSQTFKIKHFQIDPDSPSKNVAYSHFTDQFISEDRKSTTDSCLSWDDSIMYKHLACSRHIRGKIHIVNENLAVNEKLDLAINPWETEWSEFGRDLRNPYGSASQMHLDCSQDEAHSPRLFVKAYEWSDHGLPRYSVDGDLSLNVDRPIKLTLMPKLNIYTIKHGKFTEGELRPGVYLAKVALLRPESERKQGKPPLVSYINKLVSYNGETLVSTFPFRIRDLFALGNLNEVLFEFYPVDRSKVMIDGNGQPQPLSTIQDINAVIDRTSEFVSPTYAANMSLDKGSESQNASILSTDDLASLVIGGPKTMVQKNEFIIDRLISQTREIEKKIQVEYQTRTLGVRLGEIGLVLMSPLSPNSIRNFTRGLISGERMASQIRNKSFKTEEYDRAFAQASGDDLSTYRRFVDASTVDATQAQTLCAFFIEKFYRLYFEQSPFKIEKTAAMVEACAAIAEKNPYEVFAVENKYLVRGISNANDLQTFPEENIQFNTQFSLQTSHSLNTGEQNQLNASLNAGFNVRSALFSLTATTGYSHQISRVEQVSDTESTSSSVNNQKSIAVEVVPIDLTLSGYQTCRVVRLNPSIFSDSAFKWYSPILGFLYGTKSLREYLNPNIPAARIVELIRKGIMVCNDVVVKSPIVVREEYFMLDQALPANGKTKNSRDPRARGLFFAVRGRADFHRVKTILRENVLLPMKYTSHDQSLNDQFSKLQKAMEHGYNIFPGFIHRSQEPNRQVETRNSL